MGAETIQVGVTGGTPGADSNTYKLFDSTVTFGNGLRQHDITRIIFTLQNSHAGTLNAYWSANGGTTWNLYDAQVPGVPAAGASSGPFDYLVDPYADWKLEWVNGGSAQTTWRTALTLIRNFHGAGA